MLPCQLATNAVAFCAVGISTYLMRSAVLRRYARIGSVVMLLHDPSDIFLEAAKLASYAGADGAVHACSSPGCCCLGAALRLGLLPFWVIRSALCAPRPSWMI